MASAAFIAPPPVSYSRTKAKCRVCARRLACVQCCGEYLCLLHFYSSHHASRCAGKQEQEREQEKGGRKRATRPMRVDGALVKEQANAEEFGAYWEGAFRFVVQEVGAVQKEFLSKKARDPLASLEFESSHRPDVGALYCKAPHESLYEGLHDEDDEEQERERENKRRRKWLASSIKRSEDPTKRKSNWKCVWKTGKGSSGDGGSGGTAEAAPEQGGRSAWKAAIQGIYPCKHCGGRDTSFSYLGGGDANNTRKAEIWGSQSCAKVTVTCDTCSVSFVTEE